jgi:hypothetical protein
MRIYALTYRYRPSELWIKLKNNKVIRIFFFLQSIFNWFLVQYRKLVWATAFPKSLILVITIFASACWFQSCKPANDIEPIKTSNTITVKVVNRQSTASPKHFRLNIGNSTLIDTLIVGDFNYSFVTSKSTLAVSAYLSGEQPFVCSLEIDANKSMLAYHAGECEVTEYELSKDLNF